MALSDLFCGLVLLFMILCGLAWSFMTFHGLLWPVMAFYGPFMVTYRFGLAWFFLAVIDPNSFGFVRTVRTFIDRVNIMNPKYFITRK